MCTYRTRTHQTNDNENCLSREKKRVLAHLWSITYWKKNSFSILYCQFFSSNLFSSLFVCSTNKNHTHIVCLQWAANANKFVTKRERIFIFFQKWYFNCIAIKCMMITVLCYMRAACCLLFFRVFAVGFFMASHIAHILNGSTRFLYVLQLNGVFIFTLTHAALTHTQFTKPMLE